MTSSDQAKRLAAAAEMRGRTRRDLVWGLPLPYLLILPAFLTVFGMLVYPLGYALVLSFSNRVLTSAMPPRWVGFTNYVNLLAPASALWNSVSVTVRFALVDVTAEFVLGLSIALLLNREFVGRSILRVALLIPLMVPPLASGLIWRFMYDHQYGIIAHLARVIGLNPPVFLADAKLTLYAVVATEVWRASPFMVLVLLAALQAVPREIEEAAQVDGAGRLQLFWNITLPFISPVIVVALLFRTVDALRTFDLIYLLTGGGPGSSTEVVSMFIYRWGFRHFKVGFTSAGSVLLLIFTLAICIFYLRMLVKRQEATQGD